MTSKSNGPTEFDNRAGRDERCNFFRNKNNDSVVQLEFSGQNNLQGKWCECDVSFDHVLKSRKSEVK